MALASSLSLLHCGSGSPEAFRRTTPYDRVCLKVCAGTVASTSVALIEALPFIVSLIIIKGLLSVYNALAIAAMANRSPGPVHVTTWQKFIGIVLIIGVSIACLRSSLVRSALQPAPRVARIPMNSVASLVGVLLKVLSLPFRTLARLLKTG